MAMDNMLAAEQAYVDDMDVQIQQEAQVAQQRSDEQKDRAGSLMLFQMPREANASGTRIATVRFLTPYDGRFVAVTHEEWGKINMVCPAEFGFKCQICQALMAKKQVPDRAALLKNLVALTKGEKIKTDIVRGWQVWYYEAFDDKPDREPGAVALFAWKLNNTTPLEKIHTKNRYKAVQLEEGQTPVPITAYDLILTQSGEKTKRSFSVDDKPPKPFPYPERVKRLWTKEEMKFGFAIRTARFDDNRKWLEKLQELRLKAIQDGTIPPDDVKTTTEKEPDQDDPFGGDFELVLE